MQARAASALVVTASLAVLALLAVPYAIQPASRVEVYYGSGVVNPLVAGVFALAVTVGFAAGHAGYLSREVGTAAALVFGAASIVVAVGWALTARVDVFPAPGWLLPSQRFVLVGLSGIVVLAAWWYARTSTVVAAGE